MLLKKTDWFWKISIMAIGMILLANVSGCSDTSPRGFYEGEYPEHPYPEVADFTENSDGTITLTVHAVFPYEGISKVYAHEAAVRPLET